MKKNELVHLHSLLVQVASDYIERGIADREDFRAYDELDVTPMSLREPRDRHEDAVMTLVRILADLSSREPVPAEPIDADDSADPADPAESPGAERALPSR